MPVTMLHQSAGRGIETMLNTQLSQTSHTKLGSKAATPINRYGLKSIFTPQQSDPTRSDHCRKALLCVKAHPSIHDPQHFPWVVPKA